MNLPQPPPRRLERSTNDRVLAGVCGGIASYLNVDATVVRIVTAVLTVVTGGTPVLLYLLALILMPEDRRVGPPAPPHPAFPPPSGAPGPWPTPPQHPDSTIWGNEGAPWEQRQAPGWTPPSAPGTSAPRPGSDPDAGGDRPVPPPA